MAVKRQEIENEEVTAVEEVKKKRNTNKLSMQYMTDYVTEQGVEELEWFIDTFDEITKEGLTGIQRHRKLETAFKEKYMPELLAKAKAVTADDKIDELRELLKNKKKRR